MGIALVSPAASAQQVTAASDAGTAAASVDSGFASIFALQVGDLGKLLLGANSVAVEKSPGETAKQQDDEAPVDPAQILAGMLPLDQTAITPRVAPKSEKNVDGGEEKSTAATMTGSGSALLATGQEAKKEAQTAVGSSVAEDMTTGKRQFLLGESRNEAANLASGASDGEAGKNVNFAAALSQHLAAAKPGETKATSEHIATHIDAAGWSQDFSSKIVWMAKNEQQSAQLNINPPQLGPLQISLNLNGDQATAVFASPHAEVRQAIQDALPQLREMLAGAGIDLGQANVGSQLARQDNPQPRPDAPRGSGDNAILGGDFSQSAGTSTTTAVKSGRGLVDLFA